MSDTSYADLLEKMYAEILYMRKELDEIRSILIVEDDPDDDELLTIDAGMKEIRDGSYRTWSDVKRESS